MDRIENDPALSTQKSTKIEFEIDFSFVIS